MQVGATTTDSDNESADIHAARAGDSNAFARIYRRHSGWLYGLCWRLAGGDSALAEDWTQEAFVRAWHKISAYSGTGSFAGWLRRLTVNLVLADKRLKRSRVRLESLDENHYEGWAALTTAAPPWEGADTDLERAIARLPERARVVLVLYAIEGYSHDEIASMTEMAPGSSKAQLHRARQLLQEWLTA